jgi:D-glycero-D-manno-heptose 1,7-bisphosphate phosphatase
MSRSFVILDRDGTLIEERHYLCDPDQVVLLPRSVGGLLRLRELGFGLIVVTNQSGVGRGYFSEDRLQQVNRRLAELLADHDLILDGVFCCPHAPDQNCLCRKPRSGLVLQASKELGFNPTDAFVIGDKPCDIQLGRNIGATAVLVRTGYGELTARDSSVTPDAVVADLSEAAEAIAVWQSLVERSKRYATGG